MNAINISRKSGLFKFACVFGGLRESNYGDPLDGCDVLDTCVVIRKVLLGCIPATALLIFGIFEIRSAVYLMEYTFHYFFNPILPYWDNLPKPAALVLYTLASSLITAIILYAGVRFSNYIYSRPTTTKKPPGAATLLYRSWKDKFCSKVVFTN